MADGDCLRTRIETDLCKDGVVGGQVIDVSGGAGHVSSRLADCGFTIVSVKGSLASSADAHEGAGETGFDLNSHEARRLPADDETFDALVALGRLSERPRWRETLSEWARVVRPGGRLVFDLHSLDHQRLAHRGPTTEGGESLSSQQPGQVRVAIGDLVAEADAQNLAIIGVTPYGALVEERFVDPVLEIGKWWRRLLSWTAVDRRLFEFALFLEQEVVIRMPAAVTERCMVVLERRKDLEANRAWLKADGDMMTRLAAGISLEALSPLLRTSTDEFKERLNTHLRASLRNYRIFDLLCEGVKLRGVRIDIASFLEADMMTRFEDWSQRRILDREVTAQARDWIAAPHADDSLRWGGVGLGAALEYHLYEDLLTHYHGLYSGSDS